MSTLEQTIQTLNKSAFFMQFFYTCPHKFYRKKSMFRFPFWGVHPGVWVTCSLISRMRSILKKCIGKLCEDGSAPQMKAGSNQLSLSQSYSFYSAWGSGGADGWNAQKQSSTCRNNQYITATSPTIILLNIWESHRLLPQPVKSSW